MEHVEGSRCKFVVNICDIVFSVSIDTFSGLLGRVLELSTGVSCQMPLEKYNKATIKIYKKATTKKCIKRIYTKTNIKSTIDSTSTSTVQYQYNTTPTGTNSYKYSRSKAY